jgi:hypothetical protein
MNFVLWEADAITKAGIGSVAQALRLRASIESRALELHGPPVDTALEKFFDATIGPAGGPERRKLYEQAGRYLNEAAGHEGNKMKMKPVQPSLAEITKSFTGDAGAAAWAEYATSSSRDPRDAMDAIYMVFCKSLSPVVELLKRDGLSEAQAIDAAFRVTPTAYVQLRQSQNLVHANASRTSDAAVKERVMRVASIAKALCSEVAKSGGSGTAEARLLATAARFDWEE